MKFYLSKKLILVCLFLFGKYEIVFSQNYKQVRVIYIKEIVDFIDTAKVKTNKNRISDINSLIGENSKELSFELLISDYNSIFNQRNILGSDYGSSSIRKVASSFGGTNGAFYINKMDSIYLNKRHYLGEDFLVKLEVKNWHITNESKVINNIKCYKATSFDKVTNPKGSFVYNITAWFSPDLPSFFGPAGYFGLPGLILELNNGKINLKATEIYFDKSELKLKPLKKGVLISQKEFDKLVNNTARDQLIQLFKN